MTMIDDKQFLEYPDHITIVQGHRLTDIESLNMIGGNDFDTTLLSQMEVDGFEFKNGSYIIPYVDVNDMEVLQDKINQVWEQ